MSSASTIMDESGSASTEANKQRQSNLQRIQNRKQALRSWPLDKKLEKLAIYSTCKANTDCKCNGKLKASSLTCNPMAYLDLQRPSMLWKLEHFSGVWIFFRGFLYVKKNTFSQALSLERTCIGKAWLTIRQAFKIWYMKKGSLWVLKMSLKCGKMPTNLYTKSKSFYGSENDLR